MITDRTCSVSPLGLFILSPSSLGAAAFVFATDILGWIAALLGHAKMCAVS